MRAPFASVALLAAGILAGCFGSHATEEVGVAEGEMTPLDRLVIGRATTYPADLSMRDALPELRASQSVRRKQAWEIARKVLEPVTLDSGTTGADGGVTTARSLPRFQTWYAKDEILPMFDRVLRGLSKDDLAAHKPPTSAAIEEAFAWESGRARSLPGWSEQRLQQRLSELDQNGTANLGGPERVLMSPALVGHLYAHYDRILGCIGNVPGPDEPPTSTTSFAPCVGEEFPPGAVVVKARWVPDALPLEAFDTSANALSSTLARGDWGAAPRTASPGEGSIYTMRLPSGIRMRLAALHIATKELRDWMWVSLFWSDTPNTDYGADRPTELAGPFANYKMCTVVAYDEEDDGTPPPPTRAKDPDPSGSLDAAHAATRAFGPRTWCSNPYLEHGPGNAKTNCIGCHQHGGTSHTSASVLEGPSAFPDGSRAKSRANFPADYLFITGTGLELASLMKGKVDQLTPH
jgi:hypothetical protein